jgi:5,10-methylenetetrahydromethanopterin reductase
MATLQAESNGRAWLGIARGDSALAYLGRPPMPLPDFEQALGQIQTYLAGQPVDLDGYQSQIQWLKAGRFPKPPLSVAATGPRVTRLAAKIADGITFSVGADPRRLGSAIELARSERAASGLPPLRLGAYLNAVAHPDIERARELVRGRMGVYARFSTMDRRVMDSLDERDRRVAEDLVRTYDMQSHAASGARHETALSDEFVDRFGVVGPSAQVAERLTELIGLGLDHVVIVGHSRNTPPEIFAESSQRFCEEVIPAVRQSLAPSP